MAFLRAPKDALYNPGNLDVPFAFHCAPATTSALQTTPNSVVKQPPVCDAPGFCGSGIWRGRSGKVLLSLANEEPEPLEVKWLF